MSSPFIPHTVNSISYPPASPYPPIILPFVITSSYDISTGIKNIVIDIEAFDTGAPLGIYQGSNAYDGNSIRPGMWITSSIYGNGWLIKTINSQSSTTVDCDVEDVDLFNESLSPTTPSLGVNEPGFVFELSEDGLPAITNSDVRNLLNINNWQQFIGDLNARFQSRNLYTTYFHAYQPSHTLQVGNFIYIDPSDSTYKVATNDTEFNYYIIGNITSIGYPTSDWFTYRPRGKYLTPERINFPYASPLTGSVGSLYYIQPNGSISTNKPFLTSSPVYIQVSTGSTGGAGILIETSSFSSSTGSLGLQGPVGDPGPIGFQGVQGYQGLFGPTGYIGVQGLQGVQGYQGLKGDVGQGFVIFATSPSYTGLNNVIATGGNVGEFVLITGGDLFVYSGTGAGSTGPGNSYEYAGDITDESALLGIQGNQGFQGLAGVQGLSGLQGSMGHTGDFGATVFTWDLIDFNLTNSNSIISTASASAFSYEYYIIPCVVQFQAGQTNKFLAGGFTDVFENLDGLLGLDYGFYLLNNGQVRIYESGVDQGVFGTYTSSTFFMVIYDGTYIKYYIDGVLVRTIIRGSSNPLYLYLYSYTSNTAINNVHFFPMGANGLQGGIGPQGLQGLAGIQGFQGYQGLQGLAGIQGVQGYQGYQGFQGYQGLRGKNAGVILYLNYPYQDYVSPNYLLRSCPTGGNSIYETLNFTSYNQVEITSYETAYTYDDFSPVLTQGYWEAEFFLSAPTGTFEAFVQIYLSSSGTVSLLSSSLAYTILPTSSPLPYYFDILMPSTPIYPTDAFIAELNIINKNSYASSVNFYHLGTTYSNIYTNLMFKCKEGPQGPAGAASMTGAMGPQGFQGSIGVQGSQGGYGYQGLQGYQGTQGIQGPGLSYVSINTGTYYLSSNKSYIWNVPPIYNVINNGTAVLYLPTGPQDADVITVIDGLQTWGNYMYTGGISIASNSIPIIGKISNPDNPYLISVRSARQGSITFIYNSTNNTWQTYTEQNSLNPFNFNPIADKWSGWWSVTNRSNNISPENLFDTQFLPEFNNFSATSLSYVNIDTSTYPIQIVWLFGSPKNPTSFNSMTTFVHEFLNEDYTTIYNIGSTHGNYFSTTTTMNYGLPYFVKNSPGVFKLQPDNNYSIFTSPGSTGTEGLSFYPCENILLYKCSTPPPLSQSPDGKVFSYDPTNLSFSPGDDPVTLATTMFENLFLHSSPNVNDESSTTSPSVTIDYNPYTETYNGGFMTAKEIFNQFLNGITFQTSVYAVRKSYSGSSSDYFQGSTQLTDIFTNDCSYAYPGSNVVLSGFQNAWSSLNGVYTNGVSAIGDSFLRKSINPSMCDSTGSQPYNTNMFSLIKDTSSYDAIQTGAYKNFATNFGSPTVSVTHRFYSRMPYNEFVAAWIAFMQYVQGPETYSFASNISIQQSSFNKGLVETKWNRLQNSYILPFSSRGFCDAGFISRTYGEIGYFIFTGANIPLFSFNSYPNDPYQIQYAAYNQFYPSFNRINLLEKDNYDNDDILRLNKQTYIQNNYMTGCKTLYIGWIGTGATGPIENDPKYALSGFAYPLKNQQHNNTFGGSEFTSALFDLSFTPDYEYWCIQGQAKDFTPQGLDDRKYGLIIGQINPEFSSGANIGYIRLPDNRCLVDHYNLQEQSIYAPKTLNTGSSKYYREANSKVLSVITQYINSLNCDSVIIDCRYNNGGGIDGKSLAEFFGDDRNGLEYYDGYGGNGFNNLFQLSTGSDVSNELATSLQRLYVRENEENYPNSVFKGATGAQKKVIIISGMGTSGYGSVLYHYFIGDNFDKNIGSDTIVKFIGQMDSRFTGLQPSSRCIDSPPVTTSSKVSIWPYLGYQTEGNSMGCYIQHIPPTSTGPYFSLYGEHPEYLGLDVIVPMSLQETVYPDIGAYTGAFSEAQVKYPNRYLSSVPFTPILNDYTTWRDTLIEAAIQEAV